MNSGLVLLVAPFLLALSGFSSAQGQPCSCGSGTMVNSAANIATLLGGKTVCASLGTDKWQEYHAGTTPAVGTLTDYKKGPNDPVDPSKVVGSWSATGSGTSSRVVYNYGAGGTYQYQVCQNGSSLNLCGASTGGVNVVGASLVNGSGGCGF